MRCFLFIIICLLLNSFIACSSVEKGYVWKTKTVNVSAYNSTASQTDKEPNIAAWGDTLVPGIKAVAVSRDLIAIGFQYNTPVKIQGLKGVYLVKDKMHYRWKNKIDIYMGHDVKKAKKWGRKKLKVQYQVKKDSLTNT